MIRYIKYSTLAMAVLVLVGSCAKPEYSLGELTTPTDVVISTSVVGQDATHPNGDGSGKVDVTITGKGVLGYGIDYDASNGIKLINSPTGKSQRKYPVPGVNTYTITVVAYGPGAASTTVTTEVTVETIFVLDPEIVKTVVGDSGTRTWRVDADKDAHFGVGPWDPTNVTPGSWSAKPNEKDSVAPCFYSSRFTFKKDTTTGALTLTVTTPDGAFTKTGANSGGLPGIPAIPPGTEDEGCYPYAGGTSSFAFIPPSSGVDEANTTLTAIELDGNNTFIGYGSTQKEYEILSFTATTLYLRVQGAETGNAWYIKLIAL
ncbi:MAG: hypothetical protein ABWZ25_19765 [Chitinophagaceae bacterium]